MDYNSFTKQLTSGEFARSNLFEVEISIPSIVPETMRFMVKSASLPGKQLGEAEIKRFGAAYKMANDMIVANVTLTIMCSKDMREREFFDAWLSYIHGASSGDPYPNMYRFGYYDDYIHSVRITSLDRKLNEAYAVELLEAWPNNIGEVSLSWDNSEVATFTVGLTYRDWKQVETTGASTDPMPKLFNPVKDNPSSTNKSNNTPAATGLESEINAILNN